MTTATIVGGGIFGLTTAIELSLRGHDVAVFDPGPIPHLLDVADGFELRLDRAQQQPLGILGADAALRKLRVEDRNLDVRLRFHGDRAIGDERHQQQEYQGRDRQPRVADGVFDEFGHGVVSCAAQRPSCGRAA